MLTGASGILILTSNRVGVFDDAFKSRMHLALYYPTLHQDQRLKIWTNFIKRLEEIGESMDVAGIRVHLSRLASLSINGRQIRNVITTARQLALARGTPMAYKHLQYVADMTLKFEDYLLDVRGFNDEDIARQDMIR